MTPIIGMPHIQMVIKNKSGSVEIECLFFAFAESIRTSDDMIFRVRDENDHHKTMNMDEFEKYQKTLNHTMSKLHNPQDIAMILAEIRAEEDHRPTTEASAEDTEVQNMKNQRRCIIC